MIKVLLPLAALLMARPAAPGKPHGKPSPPPAARAVTSPKETPRRSAQDEAAKQMRWLLQRARGDGHSVVFPPPEIWLTSSPRH
jgi:hypothetical protein